MQSEFHKRQVAMLRRTPIKSFLQHLAFDPTTGIYELDDNKVGICFEIQPLIYASDETGDMLKTILNKPSIPDDSMVSFALWAGQDISHVTAASRMIRHERFRSTGNRDVDSILQSLSKEQTDFLEKGTFRPVEKVHKSRIRNIRGFFSLVIQKERKGKKIKYKSLDSDDRYRDMVNEIRESLNSCGFFPSVMTPEVLKKLLSSMINWQPKPNWRSPTDMYDDNTPVREQIVDMDTELVSLGNSFRLNDRYCRVLSAERLPSSVSLSKSFEYLMDPRSKGATGLKENTLICANIYYGNRKKESKSIERNRWWANNTAQGAITKLKPVVVDIARSYDLLYDSVEDGDRPCRVAFHIAIFGDSEEQVAQEVGTVESIFSKLRYRMKPENQIPIPIFFSMLPMNADPDPEVVDLIGRYKTCTTKHAVRLLPVSSEWKGMGRPVSIFAGRSGQILPFNLFDNPTNYNCLIMAESGNGKSVLSNRILADILSCGGRTIIIDQGYSYKNATELFGGQFITFSPDSCPNLNPFPFIVDFNEEKDMLIGMIVAMAKIKPNTETGTYQIAALRLLLDQAWQQKGNAMTMTDIVELAAEQPDQRVRDIAMLLRAFTDQGEYGQYYNRQDGAIDFDASRMIVLELDDLKNKEHLMQVVVLQLIIMANRYVYSKHAAGDNSWTLMLIDEAWKFMATSGSANKDENPILEFILTAYRQFRKHHAAIAMVTQSLGDVYAHPAGAAIAANAGSRIFLGQKKDVIQQMASEKKLSMDQFWLDQLLSVNTQKGHFSELFFETSASQGVGRLILSPFSLLLFSTDGDDRHALKSYTDQGYTTVDAAKLVLRDRGIPEYRKFTADPAAGIAA